MAVTSYDLITVQGEYVTADLLLWRRYKCYAPGLLEVMLDVNPHLARLHKTSPFLPVGTQLRIPIDSDILRGAPSPKTIIKLWNVGKK